MTATHVYKFLSDYIYKGSGIIYKEGDYYRLDARINQLMKELSLDSPDAVVSHYKGNVASKDHDLLIDIATNNETFFLRDKKPFDALVKGILPKLIGERNIKNVKIWSAGCSTGQEPYSILMSIDSKGDRVNIDQVSLEAGDLSTEALQKARSGIYSGLEVQRGLPAKYLVNYFSQNSDESWLIESRIRNKVNFFNFNLLTGSYPSNKYDVIFCRNVLIYQNQENRKAVLRKLYGALKPGGYLLMGSGESMIGMNLGFVQEKFDLMMTFMKPE